jgi:hypothetical protein
VDVQKLCDIELKYTSIESLDYDPGGQIYGAMEGSLAGERLAGTVRLTNLAVRRPDNVNLPTLRGVLITETGDTAWMELDGVATLRAADQARVIAARCTFRTGSDALRWLNSAFVVYEGVLDRVAVGGTARGTLHVCEVTVS